MNILDLFKHKHGYAKNCLGKKRKKCPVCNTPWPKIEKSPTEKYLQSIGHYNNYVYITNGEHIMLMPRGLSGQELIDIAKKLKPEYDRLTQGKAEEEVIKRGALEGHDKK